MYINFKNKRLKKAFLRFINNCRWNGREPNYQMKKYATRHNISSDSMAYIEIKWLERQRNKRLDTNNKSKTKEVIEILEYFKNIPYEYLGDGFDDFNKYQRPSSNGIGYVAICPGEKGNNYYTENPTAVKILKRKYEEWEKKHTQKDR